MADEDYLLEYHVDAEEPPAYLWLRDPKGDLIDFTGATFTFKIGKRKQAALMTKITGITGAVGSGAPPDGVPNVSIVWDILELSIVPPGDYRWWLYCTNTDRDRIYEGAWRALSVPTIA